MRTTSARACFVFVVVTSVLSLFFTAFLINALGGLEKQMPLAVWLFVSLTINVSGTAIPLKVYSLVKSREQAINLIVLVIGSSVVGALVQFYSGLIEETVRSRQIWLMGFTVTGSGLIVVLTSLLELKLTGFRETGEK